MPLQWPPQPAKVWVASFQLAVSVTSDASRCVVVPVGSTLPPAPAVTVRVWVRSGVNGGGGARMGESSEGCGAVEAGWAPMAELRRIVAARAAASTNVAARAA